MSLDKSNSAFGYLQNPADSHKTTEKHDFSPKNWRGKRSINEL